MHRDENETYSYGMELLAERNFKEAVKYFSVVIKQGGNVARAYLMRAKANYYLNHNNAINDCCKALESPSESIKKDAYATLGRIFLDTNDYPSALIYLDCAIKLHEKNDKNPNLAFYFNRAITNSFLKLTECAIIDFEKAVAINPDDLNSVALLAEEYREAKDNFNSFRCLIRELFLHLKVNRGMTQEYIQKYKKSFALFGAEEIIYIVLGLPTKDAMELLQQDQSKENLIQKFYPPASINTVAFYFKLAQAFNSHAFFKHAAIEMFLKVIVTELKMGKAALTEDAIKQLKLFQKSKVASTVEGLPYDDVQLLLKQCRNKQTLLGAICSDEQVNGVMHTANYKKYMFQTESLRSSARGLNLLFSPSSQSVDEASDLLVPNAYMSGSSM